MASSRRRFRVDEWARKVYATVGQEEHGRATIRRESKPVGHNLGTFLGLGKEDHHDAAYLYLRNTTNSAGYPRFERVWLGVTAVPNAMLTLFTSGSAPHLWYPRRKLPSPNP
jgi:hypothetical protein